MSQSSRRRSSRKHSEDEPDSTSPENTEKKKKSKKANSDEGSTPEPEKKERKGSAPDVIEGESDKDKDDSSKNSDKKLKKRKSSEENNDPSKLKSKHKVSDAVLVGETEDTDKQNAPQSSERNIKQQNAPQSSERNIKQRHESKKSAKSQDSVKSKGPIGVPVYQIEVRFIIYKGFRLCGGVRVILNCPEETAYLQLITLMNEVFVTYDINNIYFLESRSAAGVSFCAIPWSDPANEEDNSNTNADYDDDNETEEGKTGQQSFEEKRIQRCQERKKENPKTIDHAEIVFYSPEQMIRFKTVVDTLICATSCDGNNQGNSFNDELEQNTPKDEQSFGPSELSFEQTCFEQENTRAHQLPPPSEKENMQMMRPQCARYSMPQTIQPPLTMSQGHCPQQATGRPIKPNPQTQRLVLNGPSNCGPGRQSGYVPPSPPSISSSSTRPQGTGYNPNQLDQKKMQPFDPCPKGPVTMSGVCLPSDLGDPYELSPDNGRVVFCTPACLKVCWRSGNKLVYKGKLKILQGSGGIGFMVQIEDNNGERLYSHSLRRDLVLYPTNEVDYGFHYSTVVCMAGRTTLETFVVAFPSSYQKDQFKQAVSTCKDILAMTSVQCLNNG